MEKTIGRAANRHSEPPAAALQLSSIINAGSLGYPIVKLVEQEVVAQVTLPSQARRVQSPINPSSQCLHVMQGVKRGQLHMFLHHEDIGMLALMRNMKIKAIVEPWKLQLEDGSKCIILGLTWLPEHRRNTHRFVIHTTSPNTKHPDALFTHPILGTGAAIEIRKFSN